MEKRSESEMSTEDYERAIKGPTVSELSGYDPEKMSIGKVPGGLISPLEVIIRYR